MRLTSKYGWHSPIDSDTINALYKKLATYEDAEEQGLLVWLPCKVGDTFYYIAGTLRGSEYITTATVAAFDISNTKPWIIDTYGCSHIEYWFTREEAEAALKGEK